MRKEVEKVIKMTNDRMRQIKNAQGLCVLEQTKLSYSRDILSILERDPSLVDILSNKLDLLPSDLFHKLSGEEMENISFYDQGLDIAKTYAKRLK